MGPCNYGMYGVYPINKSTGVFNMHFNPINHDWSAEAVISSRQSDPTWQKTKMRYK
jgi:hypothetical protein